MWIIPKNLDVSVCVRDTLDSSWDSDELSLLLERSATWRSKPSLARTWSQRLKRVSWMQLLFGRILRPSMDGHFIRGYTSSLQVIPARERAVLASDSEKETPDGFGRILRDSLRQLNLFGSSEKMLADTLALDSPQFTEAYKLWVIKLRLDCLQRQRLARHIREKDCLSWRSPAEQPAAIKTDKLVGELGKRMYHKETGRLAQYGLEQQVNWLTAKVTDTEGGLSPAIQTSTGFRNPRGHGSKLKEAVAEMECGLLNQDSPSTLGKSQGLFPTPATVDAGSYYNKSKSAGANLRPTLGAMAKHNLWRTPSSDAEGGKMEIRSGCNARLKLRDQTKGKLNPDWVEQLMGLPVGWTALDYLETG